MYLYRRPAAVPAGLYIDPEYALQTLRPDHGSMLLRCRLDRVPAREPGATARRHLCPQTAIGREYPVKAREVYSRFRNEGCQARDEI